MFKFLKEKLKGAISKLTRKAEKETSEEAEESIEEKKEEINKLEKEKKELKKEKEKVEKEIRKAREKAGKKKKEEKKAGEEREKPKKAKPEKPAKEEERKEAVKEKVKEEKKEKEPEAKEKLIVEKPAKKEKPKEEIIEEKAPEKEEAPEPEQRIKELEKEKEEIQEEEREIEAEEKEKKGFFSKLREKITKTTISAESFEKLFWDLEVALLENNVAVEVIDKVKEDLKKSLVDNPIPRGKVDETIAKTLKGSIRDVLSAESIDIEKRIREKKGPYVICFIGVNGSGKTTSIAKFASYLKGKGISCVIAASDTFRAAAIDQLQVHAGKLGVKLVRHGYGADAAAVAFDAIKHAEAKSVDAVLIDTAGRMHSNLNLMDEMKKIVRVAKPDLKVFVGESIVGNDCIEQAKEFNDAVGIDAIILSKVDVDEKGGASISVSYVTKKPIMFIGTGQEYNDLEKFNPEIVLESLGL